MDKVRQTIESLGVGNVADALKVKQPTVSAWLARGRVSHTQVKNLSELIGIPPHEIRPDIFPAPGKAA